MKQNIRKSMGAVVALVGLMMMPVDVRGQQPRESSELEAMARTAATPEEHARVAKQYRLRAEQFEAKAATHEAAAKRMRIHPNPLAQKWPSANSGAEREVQLALQARRAAQENYKIAARHVGLAVETDHAVN
jgi:hypothetical protein